MSGDGGATRTLLAAARCVASVDGIPVVLTGDCVACLGVIAGIQHRGIAAALVWFDAHGDFHTESTTTSGYLGGLLLAKAVGRGDLTLPSALGMSALPEEWVILSDGRDLDPAEVDALASSRVRTVAVQHLDPSVLPTGPVIIHVDLDVIDPAQLRGLRFPAPGGPALAAVAEAVRAVAATRPLAALTSRPPGCRTQSIERRPTPRLKPSSSRLACHDPAAGFAGRWLVAECGGGLVSDPLPHRDGALQLGAADELFFVELSGVEADGAYVVVTAGRFVSLGEVG